MKTPFPFNERFIVTKTDMFKQSAKFLVQLGAGRITYAIINNNVDAEENKKIDVITVPLASIAIGGMVAEASGQYTDRLIDETIAHFHQIKNLFKNTEDTSTTNE